MRTRIRASLAAAAITVLCGNAAFADNLKTYFHVGSWDAFSGPGADGRPLCGVGSTNPTDNRSFSLRFAVGGDSVLFQVKKPNWNIPSGTQNSRGDADRAQHTVERAGRGQWTGGRMDDGPGLNADIRRPVPWRQLDDVDISHRERAAVADWAEWLDGDQQRIRSLRDGHGTATAGPAIGKRRSRAASPNAAIQPGAGTAGHICAI
jgi:hypothetical protein